METIPDAALLVNSVAVSGKLTRPNPRILDIGTVYEASGKELRRILSLGNHAVAGVNAACRRSVATGSRTDPAGAA